MTSMHCSLNLVKINDAPLRASLFLRRPLVKPMRLLHFMSRVFCFVAEPCSAVRKARKLEFVLKLNAFVAKKLMHGTL